MSTLKYEANSSFQTGSLSSGYTSGGGSMFLTSGHGDRFPSSGDFWIRVDDEILKVTARTGDTLTVTGAQDGTSAANHSAGVSVRHIISVSALDQLRADKEREMTISAFDALTSADYKNGDRIYLTDGVYDVVRISDAWAYRYGGLKVYRPPSSGWSWDNQGTSTISSATGFERLVVNQQAQQLRARYRSSPGTTFTLEALLSIDSLATEVNIQGGISVRDASGKFVTFNVGYIGSAYRIATTKWTNSTTYSADYFTDAFLKQLDFLFLKIVVDSTNITFSYSFDKINFVQFDQRAKTNFLGDVTLIGFQLYNDTAANTAGISLISWNAS